eukprot:1222584-Rhodomonas_salina.1
MEEEQVVDDDDDEEEEDVSYQEDKHQRRADERRDSEVASLPEYPPTLPPLTDNLQHDQPSRTHHDTVLIMTCATPSIEHDTRRATAGPGRGERARAGGRTAHMHFAAEPAGGRDQRSQPRRGQRNALLPKITREHPLFPACQSTLQSVRRITVNGVSIITLDGVSGWRARGAWVVLGADRGEGAGAGAVAEAGGDARGPHPGRGRTQGPASLPPSLASSLPPSRSAPFLFTFSPLFPPPPFLPCHLPPRPPLPFLPPSQPPSAPFLPASRPA